jgi:hypothetical protein
VDGIQVQNVSDGGKSEQVGCYMDLDHLCTLATRDLEHLCTLRWLHLVPVNRPSAAPPGALASYAASRWWRVVSWCRVLPDCGAHLRPACMLSERRAGGQGGELDHRRTHHTQKDTPHTGGSVPRSLRSEQQVRGNQHARSRARIGTRCTGEEGDGGGMGLRLATCTHTHPHTQATCTHTHTQATCTHTHTQATCTHTHTHTQATCTHTHTHTQATCTHTHTHTQATCTRS